MTAQRYARLDAQGLVLECFDPIDDRTGKVTPLESVFLPETAALFIECPVETVPGSIKAGKKWTHPAPTAPRAERLPALSAADFYRAFTPQERIAIKASTDPAVMDFWETYQLALQTKTLIDPNLPSVAQGVQYLAAQSLVAEDRVASILRGVPQ